MPTSRYEDKRGNRLPSVTQILGLVWSKPALISWAHSEGLKGRPLNKTRDDAAASGSAAHELILSRIGGPKPILDSYTHSAIKEARISDHHAVSWIDEHEFEPVLVEQPLVSSKLGFGGTPDWYGLVDGVPTVLDIKTSKRVYPDHFVQAAAYAMLLKEAGHKVEALAVLQSPRAIKGQANHFTKTGSEMIDPFTRGFELALELYNLRNMIGY